MNDNIKAIADIIRHNYDVNRRMDINDIILVTAVALDRESYRKQSDTVKEFAEKLKTELFAKCVVIQTISNPQTEDMNSEEAYTIIEQLAEQYSRKTVVAFG
jgi:1-aminocyclopropane-1-carboxylate deaminase/D-cysteine desulfhydrase-like pyridoxal-dependent ACC family enzyme